MKVTISSAVGCGVLNPSYSLVNSCPQWWACGLIWGHRIQNKTLATSMGLDLAVQAQLSTSVQPASLCLNCLSYRTGPSAVIPPMCAHHLFHFRLFRFNTLRKALDHKLPQDLVMGLYSVIIDLFSFSPYLQIALNASSRFLSKTQLRLYQCWIQTLRQLPTGCKDNRLNFSSPGNTSPHGV